MPALSPDVALSPRPQVRTRLATVRLTVFMVNRAQTSHSVLPGNDFLVRHACFIFGCVTMTAVILSAMGLIAAWLRGRKGLVPAR